MKRRDFVKRSCTACLLLGAGLMLDTITSCAAPQSIYKAEVANNRVTIPLSNFADKDLQIVRPKDFEYDVALQKEKDGTYLALLMRCTHADNQVANTGSGYYCSLHGSTFDKEGNVTKGPAANPLKQLKTTVSIDHIIIQLN